MSNSDNPFLLKCKYCGFMEGNQDVLRQHQYTCTNRARSGRGRNEQAREHAAWKLAQKRQEAIIGSSSAGGRGGEAVAEVATAPPPVMVEAAPAGGDLFSDAPDQNNKKNKKNKNNKNKKNKKKKN